MSEISIVNDTTSVSTTGEQINVSISESVSLSLNFTNLTDTPSTYTGQANKLVQVNSAEDALEFSSETAATWGSITGTLSNQTDLQSALDAKEEDLTFSTGLTRTTNTITVNNSEISIPASQVTDFDTEVSNNTDVTANTSARHDAVTVTDSSEIDFTLTGQDITASLINSSIDETKLDTSVNASLDLADSSLQSSDIGVSVQGYDVNTAKYDDTTANFTGTLQNGASNVLVDSDIGTNVQAHSSVLDNTTASYTISDETKVDFISVTQAVDLDTMESDITTNNAKVSNVTTNLSEGTSTTTTVDVNSSDGTNATIQPASTSRAGVMSKAKFDEVEANNSKVSYPGSASATELNILDGATLTTTELNYVDGVTSAIQTQLNAKVDLSGDTMTGALIAADHGTAATDQVINVCYGTGSPPTANTTTIGTLFVKYTA